MDDKHVPVWIQKIEHEGISLVLEVRDADLRALIAGSSSTIVLN